VRVRTAVGASAGEVRLKLNPRHHADHRVASGNGPEPDGETVAVPLVTIDEYLEERDCTTPVCFIKIDVQGYEPAVCYGAERTLARNPRVQYRVRIRPGSDEGTRISCRRADGMACGARICGARDQQERRADGGNSGAPREARVCGSVVHAARHGPSTGRRLTIAAQVSKSHKKN